MFQNHSQVFERLHPLYTLRLVLTCEAEGHLRALARDHNVPPLPLNLHVPVAPLCPLVLNNPPRWNLNATQVTVRQRLLPLLYHRYPRVKVSVHQVLPRPARDMRYCQSAYHRSFHHLQHPRVKTSHRWLVPPPSWIYTSLVCGTLLTCCLYICLLRYDAATITLHSVQIYLDRFISLNVSPYHFVRRLYASSLHYPHM